MKKKHKPRNPLYDSNFEENFHRLWKQHSSYPIVFHHTVCVPTTNPKYPTRKWEIDFCFPQDKVAIELQGYGTGHLSYLGMKRDYAKHNDLLLAGWIVLYFMSADIQNEPTTTLEIIFRVLEERGRPVRNFSPNPSGRVERKTNPLIEAARRLQNKRFD